MNKKIIFFPIFIIFIQSILFGQNDPTAWSNILNRADTVSEKKELTKKIYEAATSGYEPLAKDILDMQIDYSFQKNDDQEKEAYEEWVYYSVQLAKKIELKDVSDKFYKLFYRVNKTSIKEEIYLLMGKMGNVHYLPWLNSELENLNYLHEAGMFKDEEILYFLLRGLEFYNDPSSFHQIFYTAIPNYSPKIRKLSQEILKKITNDPAALCIEIIRTEQDQNVKLEALKYAIDSQSPNENKIAACKAALDNSMTSLLQDPSQNGIQTKLRDDSCYYLGEYKAVDSESLSLILKKWDFDKNVGSRITTIGALEKIGTEDAGRVLADKLNFLIEKKQAGGKTGFDDSEPKRVVIALIRALANIGGQVGLEELQMINTNPDFESTIQKEAGIAIRKKSGK